ncbi:MAG: CPBP family intramembrane glutamic endopeptidase [Nitrososphaeria archaeon]
MVSVLILCLAITMILSFILGPYVIFNTEDGRSIENETQEYYVFFIGFLISFPFATSMQQQFVAEWVVYLSIFTVYAFSETKTLPQALKNGFLRKLEDIPENSLSATISIFCITAVLVLIVDILQSSIGISSGSLPKMNPAKLLTIITHAPVAEEIGFRLSIIGLFSFPIVRGWKTKVSFVEYLTSPAATLRKGNHTTVKEDKITALFLPLIAVSAILFGLAHISPGSTWEIGKLSEAVVAGVMLGFAYAYYGLGAAILVHWAFNYYTNALYIFEDKVFNMNISFFSDLMVGSLGTILIIYYVAIFVSRRAKRSAK